MKREEIVIETDFITLSQLLKWIGLAGTGGEAKAFIREGRITINGEVEPRPGRKLYPKDEIRIEDTFSGILVKESSD